MKSELVTIEDISLENAPAIYVQNGLDAYIEKARQESDEVADVSTAKGRARAITVARNVSKSKKAVEDVGRAYLKLIKAKPKIIEAELRNFVTKMDALRDERRQPVTDWEEAEKLREAEEAAKIEADRLEAQKENDHEIGILLNDKLDRERLAEAQERARLKEQEAAAAEAARIAREDEIRRKAAEDAENAKIEAVRAAAAAKQAAIDAEARRVESERVAEENRIEAEKVAKQAAIDAAERSRLAEIARQEAEAEAERVATEAREANTKHAGAVLRKIKEHIMSVSGVDEATAKKIVLGLRSIDEVTINY